MLRYTYAFSMSILAFAGCVIVHPQKVHVAASPMPVYVGAPEPEDPQATYHYALDRVLNQQGTVAKEIEKRDWDELVDEANDWMEYTRTLNANADKSKDPKRLRQSCAQLLTEIDRLRSGAIRHDAAACERSLRACDPLLDRLSRDTPAPSSPQPARSQVP